MSADAQTLWKLEFVTADDKAAELALEAFGATTYSTERTEDRPDAPWRFGIYFEGEPDISTLVLPPDADIELAPLPPRDWVSESQANLPPVSVPPFYLHGSHDKPMAGNRLNIEMQAGLAFGSGHHGTTQGCLHLFGNIVKRRSPQRVADIGCGSGTLAIAAAKTGCRAVYASDNDPVAIDVTRANMKTNHMAPRITAFVAAGTDHAHYQQNKFDLIFANIMAGPLINLAADFDRLLSTRGQLILSGMMNEQARKVIARYRSCNLIVEQKIIIGPWTSLCLRR